MPARSFSIAVLSPKPLMVRLQPSCAKARAMARPIPDVEPVTMTDLPLSMTVTFRVRALISDIAAALLHCNKNVNRSVHVCATGIRYRNSMASVFPAPDHDHARCAADALAHAEALCVKRGERLTAMRRHVLEVLSASHKPLGAYEIIDLVAARGPRPAPITIYR